MAMAPERAIAARDEGSIKGLLREGGALAEIGSRRAGAGGLDAICEEYEGGIL
jgi:hypothetical protein